MYESLTVYIDKLNNIDAGVWIVEDNKMPWIKYSDVVLSLMKEIHRYVFENEDLSLRQYNEILKRNGIDWSHISMKKVDVSKLDGTAVIALLMGAVRADRFCEGALLDLCKSGCITRWLQRLKEMDEA